MPSGSTDRLSDSDRATLMGGTVQKVYGWAAVAVTTLMAEFSAAPMSAAPIAWSAAGRRRG